MTRSRDLGKILLLAAIWAGWPSHQAVGQTGVPSGSPPPPGRAPAGSPRPPQPSGLQAPSQADLDAQIRACREARSSFYDDFWEFLDHALTIDWKDPFDHLEGSLLLAKSIKSLKALQAECQEARRLEQEIRSRARPFPEGWRDSLVRFERMLADLESECRRERAVLDMEWKGIDAQDDRIRERMKRVSPGRDEAGARPEQNPRAVIDEALRQEEERLKALRDSQQREVENERAAVAADAGAIAARQRELDAYIASWRCPANLTLEQCEQPQAQNPGRTIHLKERLEFRARCQAVRAEIANRTRALEVRRRALESRSQSVPRLNDGRLKAARAEYRSARVRADADDRERRKVEEADREFRRRLRQFREDSERLRALEDLLAKGKQILSQSLAAQPR